MYIRRFQMKSLRKRDKSILLLAGLLVTAIFAAGEIIDPNDYDKSAEIKFQGYTGTTPLTNFPALLEFRDGYVGFRYSDMESDDYSDLRFTKDDGITSIPFEVEEWNSTLARLSLL
jgi:hypothetical protein